MKPVLVLYATREGQSRKVAAHVSHMLSESSSVTSELLDAAELPGSFDLARYVAVVLVASVHMGKHEGEMLRFVRKNRATLAHMPTALLSLSLSHAGAQDPLRTPAQREKGLHDTAMMIERFFVDTGFRTPRVLPVAGALVYTKYGPFVRFLMKRIARAEGASTDTTRDHEFTDFAAVERFVRGFVAELPRRTAAGVQAAN